MARSWQINGFEFSNLHQLYDEGLIKAIGICNCNRHHLEELLQFVNVPPAALELEVHPLFTNDAVVNLCHAYNIQVISYTPMGRMHDVLIKAKPIRMLADRYNVSVARIILSWHILQNRIPIPSTINKNHFNDMFNESVVLLDEKELAWISSLNDNIRLRYNPDMCDYIQL